MKWLVIAGLIILVLSAFFVWDEEGEYVKSGLSGNLPFLEELSVSVVVGGFGVFVGLVLILIGFWKRRT